MTAPTRGGGGGGEGSQSTMQIAITNKETYM